MRSLAQEFKEFINRGNVVDLAVAVVIGVAFGTVIASFTDDILGGILGAIGGQPSLAQFSITIGEGQIRWGAFLDAIIGFLIIALAVFLVVKAINKMQSIRRGPAEEEEEERTEVELLGDILEELRRQR
jgi:large conductance mechanosensitive channel